MAAYSSVWGAEFVLSASPSAFAPSGPTRLPRRLRTRAESVCQRLLTLACRLRRAERVCGSVLERFCRRVGADEAGNDGGGEDSESTAPEVDRFDRLLAPKLLDGERVTVVMEFKTAKIGVSAAADSREIGEWRRT